MMDRSINKSPSNGNYLRLRIIESRATKVYDEARADLTTLYYSQSLEFFEIFR